MPLLALIRANSKLLGLWEETKLLIRLMDTWIQACEDQKALWYDASQLLNEDSGYDNSRCSSS